MGVYLLLAVVSYLVGCGVVGEIGKEKGIGFWSPFFISLICSPVFGILCVIASKEKEIE